MAKKNKGKNKQANKQPNVVKQPAIKTVATNDPKVIESNDIIQRSQAEAEKIVNDAKIERDEILEETAQKKNEIIESYKDEAIEIASKNFDEYKTELNAEIELKQKALDEKIKEADHQLETCNSSIAEYETKMAELVKNKANLEEEKRTYKSTILEEIYKDSDTKNRIDELERNIADCEKTIRENKSIIDNYKQDEEYYQSQIENLKSAKTRNIQLEFDNDDLSKRMESLSNIAKERNEEIEKLRKTLITYGENPTEFIKEKELLSNENIELKDKLALLPTIDEYESLKAKNADYDQKLEEIQSLKKELAQNESKLIELDAYANDLDNAKKFIRILELQREELQVALGQIQDLYNQKQNIVFSSLSKYDDEKIKPAYKNVNISLKDLCDNFRNYLANRRPKPLYYSERSIRTFIAGLGASRLLILQGMSGTGKSSLPKAFEEYFGSVTDRVPVQSSWKDRNDLLGFYNDFEKRFKETAFLKALYRATRDENNIHLIMLDEMNISRIEYYFADFLSILEEENPGKWLINLLPNDVSGSMPKHIANGDILVRENTWFIGTANRDDSTQDITDKVYDRAIVLDFAKREDDFKAPMANPIEMSYAEFAALLKNAVQLTAEEETKIKDKISFIDQIMQYYFEVSFGNRIGNQILQFVPAYKKCGGTENEAIDIIISTKVVRKLENVYKDDMADCIDAARNELREKFKGELSLTDDALVKLKNTIG